MTAATQLDALMLFQRGILSLEQVEANGIAVDEAYCQHHYKSLESRIKQTESRLQNTDVVKEWRKAYPKKFNIDSNEQLASVLYERLGYEPAAYTENDQPATSEAALEALGIPMMKGIVQLRKMQKARNTYLAQIIRETIDGICHPIYKLQTAVSYRGSCSKPSFQNMPVRDPVVGRLIRGAFISRDGRLILELDLKGQEVRVGACYHKDPQMITYITDPTTDMHRDMAMECYRLPEKEITKPIRHCAKNMFVFPEFYGDYFASCALALWGAIDKMKLVTASGIPLGKHLASVGLGTLEAFTRHIKAVEKDFWGRRFRGYDQWRTDYYDAYLQRGHFDYLTGFRCSGIVGKKEVCNYPIQGAAFHCLLWVLIELQEWLGKKGMKSLITGQIHDSIIMDVVPEELEEILEKVTQLITQEIREEWPWIIVPLDFEAEASPVNGNWYEKKAVDGDA